MVQLRLKEILQSKGLKQTDLARDLGVTAVTVNSWTTGRRLPTLETLDRIATLLQVPITELFALPSIPAYTTTITTINQ